MALSSVLIRTMYQHGAFTSQDTTLVVRIQIFYLLRVPFSTCLVLVTRTLTALRANHFLLVMSVGSFIVNALLDWAFIQRLGIAGITLSTSVCSVFILVGLGVALYRLLGKRSTEAPV
jgi:putative peptidoglycan lipid II flippase